MDKKSEEMNNEEILQYIIDNHTEEWKSAQRAYGYIKTRTLLIVVGAILALSAVGLYFFLANDLWPVALIPAMIALGMLYFVIFRQKKPAEMISDACSTLIPIIIHLKSLNLEYEYTRKPYITEFRSSRLYPYGLTKLQGRHFFSGIARQLPFLAWFVEASYRQKVGESALSMASTSSEFNGFNGYEILVKNLRPDQRGIVAIQKANGDDIEELNRSYQNNPKWKRLKSDDANIRKSFNIYTLVSNPANILNQWTANKLGKLLSLNAQPFALAFKSQKIYLHEYHTSDPFEFNIKISLRENVKNFISNIDKLVEISYYLGLP